MNSKSRFLAALLVGFLFQAADASPSRSDPATAGSKAAPAGPEAELVPEMPAGEVTRIMGRPSSVRPMKVQAGKAEVWTYSRQLADKVDYLQMSTPVMTAVPSGKGTTRMAVTGEKVEIRAQHNLTTELVEVLMFNDQFVTQKVSRQESVRIY
ncbi:MAG TPA: hypothetical protein VKG78_05055 [Opitutaceae bacterium]|nr:hypothetical protein [Opitutaceae bacterium]